MVFSHFSSQLVLDVIRIKCPQVADDYLAGYAAANSTANPAAQTRLPNGKRHAKNGMKQTASHYADATAQAAYQKPTKPPRLPDCVLGITRPMNAPPFIR